MSGRRCQVPLAWDEEAQCLRGTCQTCGVEIETIWHCTNEGEQEERDDDALAPEPEFEDAEG